MRIHGIDSDQVQAWQAGALDAHQQVPVRRRADQAGLPCRHCLGPIEAGADFLVLSHRPFDTCQPYAEQGPILLHADACPAYTSDALPPLFARWNPLFLRAYGADDWIRYGDVRMCEGGQLLASAAPLLADPEVGRLQVRSIWGCFLFEIARS
ncbi:MAG: DUF1203 domain-containing protein [Myxococcota bacterium]